VTRYEWDSLFSLDLPDEWTVEGEEDVISLFDPQGAGAVTISVGQRSGAIVPSAKSTLEQEVRNAALANLRNLSSRASSDDNGQHVWAEVCGVNLTTNRFVRSRSMDDGKRVVALSYNCEIVDQGVEEDAVADIFESFRWLPAVRGAGGKE